MLSTGYRTNIQMRRYGVPQTTYLNIEIMDGERASGLKEKIARLYGIQAQNVELLSAGGAIDNPNLCITLLPQWYCRGNLRFILNAVPTIQPQQESRSEEVVVPEVRVLGQQQQPRQEQTQNQAPQLTSEQQQSSQQPSQYVPGEAVAVARAVLHSLEERQQLQEQESMPQQQSVAEEAILPAHSRYLAAIVIGSAAGVFSNGFTLLLLHMTSNIVAGLAPGYIALIFVEGAVVGGLAGAGIAKLSEPKVIPIV